MIAENLREVRQEIQESCALVGRDEKSVRLVAVTKTVSSQVMRQLTDLNVLDLAENRTDVFLEKKQELADIDTICWHFIGNLQRRKVKLVINEIDYFHALDSLSLAAEIQKRAEHVIKCFVEVNVSGEASKHGVAPAELSEFILALAAYDKIQVVGLMTMAPFGATVSVQRDVFGRLRQLQQEIEAANLVYAPCHELSMGMSNDFQAAIYEGATFIRVGTALVKDV
ncbi:YggS family pyridoxal phosphate enzyme [Enterococcus sp. DIV0755b]|uniref:YggS family pyridoxal phosphate-dependent enzyme n=1 Tax=Enterococcus sp. DIV0755b TaxID=2774657 RepID=UPI003F212BFD